MPKLTREEINYVPEEIGIYKIYAKSANNDPIPINRFTKKDNSGLLYIGRTKRQNLKIRLYQFFVSSNPRMVTYNHSGGLKYCNYEIIRQILGEGHYLFFEYKIVDDCILKEKELLTQYAREFGEYPPLNK